MTEKHAKVAFDLTAATLKPQLFKVLIGLCFNADDSGALEPVPLIEWGRRFGYKRTAVIAAITTLTKMGLLQRRVQKQGRGKSDHTFMTLSLGEYAKAERKKRFHSPEKLKRLPIKQKDNRAHDVQLSLGFEQPGFTPVRAASAKEPKTRNAAATGRSRKRLGRPKH